MMIKKTFGSQKAKKLPLKMENNISTSSIVSLFFPLWICRKKKLPVFYSQRLTCHTKSKKTSLYVIWQAKSVILPLCFASKNDMCDKRWLIHCWLLQSDLLKRVSSETNSVKSMKNTLLWASLYKDPLWSDSLAQGFHRKP